MKPGFRDLLWMAVGAVVLLAFVLLVLHFRESQTPAEQLAFRATRVELVERMRLSVALASEAEKSAVMAITDEDSQIYADKARAATAVVEQGRRELEQLQRSGGTRDENALLTQFSAAFAEFQRIDKGLLELAVENTNLKAYGLAFGPATETERFEGDVWAKLGFDGLVCWWQDVGVAVTKDGTLTHVLLRAAP